MSDCVNFILWRLCDLNSKVIYALSFQEMLFIFFIDSYFGDRSSYAENVSTMNFTSSSSARGLNSAWIGKTPLSSSRSGCRSRTPLMGYSGRVDIFIGLALFKSVALFFKHILTIECYIVTYFFVHVFWGVLCYIGYLVLMDMYVRKLLF